MNSLKKKVLITGGSGYIGTFIAHYLKKNNYEIDILDIKKPIFKNFQNFFKINLLKSKFKNKNKKKYDLIVHLASNTQPRESIHDVKKYIHENLLMTVNLLDIFDFNKFIFFSTANLYSPNFKINEKSKINPQSPYGESKLVVENFIKWQSNIMKKKFCIFRLFNAVGGDIENKIKIGSKLKIDLLIPIIFEKLKQNKYFKIFGNSYNTKDGTCVRDLIHVYDIAEAIIKYEKSKLKNRFEIFNLGTGNPISVLDVVKFIKKNFKPELKYKFTKSQQGDPSYITCDPRKIKKTLKWKSKFSTLDTIVQSYINSFL